MATPQDVNVHVGDATAGPSRDLAKAKDAYKTGDLTASKAAHDAGKGGAGAAPEKHGGAGSEFIKSIIYGGLDGIITTFSVVAASSGAGLSTEVLLLMAWANLIADGISMGFGDYLSSKAELDFNIAEMKREEWETENYLVGEKREMVELYMGKGMSEEDATQVIDIFAKHKKLFIDLMMVEELGILPPDNEEEPWKNGLVTFLAFLGFGSVPVWFYVGFHAAKITDTNLMFLICCIGTALTMFGLGAFKAKFTNQNKIISGLWMLANGTLAAVCAYFVGWALEVWL